MTSPTAASPARAQVSSLVSLPFACVDCHATQAEIFDPLLTCKWSALVAMLQLCAMQGAMQTGPAPLQMRGNCTAHPNEIPRIFLCNILLSSSICILYNSRASHRLLQHSIMYRCRSRLLPSSSPAMVPGTVRVIQRRFSRLDPAPTSARPFEFPSLGFSTRTAARHVYCSYSFGHPTWSCYGR